MPFLVVMPLRQALPRRILGELKDVQIRSGEVWVSGWYNDALSITAVGTYAGRWNGAGWDHFPIDQGTYPDASASGWAVLVPTGDEWVVDDTVFWQRDGTTWIEADLNPGTTGLPVRYLGGTATDAILLAGGEYDITSPAVTPRLRSYDGSTWDTPLFGGGIVTDRGQRVHALSVDPDGDAWFGGFRDDGLTQTFWRGRVDDGGSTYALYGVAYGIWARTATSVWVAGYVLIYHPELNDNIPTMEVQHSDGSTWTSLRGDLPVPPGGDQRVAELTDIHGTSDSNVWAGGWYVEDTYNLRRGLVVQYNGTAWTLHDVNPMVSNPTDEEYFQGIYVAGASDVWVVGTRYTTAAGYTMIVFHWDGTGWTDRSPTI